jgi:hypothetical protein
VLNRACTTGNFRRAWPSVRSGAVVLRVAWLNGRPSSSAKARATVIEVENGSPSPSVRASGRASEEACASRVHAPALRASAWGNSLPEPCAADFVST